MQLQAAKQGVGSRQESFLTADNADEHGRKEKEPSSQNLAQTHSDSIKPASKAQLGKPSA